MNKREAAELAEATRKIVARWQTLSHAERSERLKAAGILDEQGHLAARYRSSPEEEQRAREAEALVGGSR
jgi:hypothetical protein